MQAYLEAAAQTINAEPEARLRAEFAEMKKLYEFKLGHSLDDERARASFSIQNELRQLQSIVARRLDEGQVSPEDYVERVEELLTASMIQNRALFGGADFDKIFGPGGVECGGIIDRQQFRGRHNYASSAPHTAA